MMIPFLEPNKEFEQLLERGCHLLETTFLIILPGFDMI
jgi:hypothetical protein